ncbi:ornithine carbamoyltransferase [Roseospirillum parvum]|uniref:Ornithine carbamoyltransferase n=1 Tax=Roseospirillum parvum TaxID=83401 RepID=A0A1G7U5G3_9PROT|nr:ornithine carbamoyltransferase [Roseospirillum parvum]SDG42501.1 ornithine carbamoyltransferase [Roseospirillum parvum]
MSAIADSGPAAPRHFLDFDRLDGNTLKAILGQAHSLKKGRRPEPGRGPLAGRTLALIFEKPSTRTRVSFELAMRQLGGDVVILSDRDSQMQRGETMADTARVLSRYVDAIMIRTGDPARLAELAEYATVPVINGLTGFSHPCQLMADVMTLEEHLGSPAGKVVAWSGDGNNVANSWIQAAAVFGFEMRVACPDSRPPDAGVIAWARAQGATVKVTTDPVAAVAGADVVVTDTWVSMDDDEASDRHNLMRPYQVNAALMAHAKPQALFMHCLPAHRGEEVTAEVIDGPRSVVWDEAENRLHAQKSILAWCLAEG